MSNRRGAATLCAPPVPPDANLTHFDDMPLEVRRLRDSGIAGEADAEAFRCAVLSWCAAWHQVPAGSLPADDASLCRLVGLGRDLETWRKIKASAMRGWRLFSDGRLYHQVLSEKVVERWNSSRLHRWTKECDRLRKDNKARADRQEPPLPFPPRPSPIPFAWPTDGAPTSAGSSAGFPAEIPDFPPETENFPPETAEIPPEKSDFPPENRLKGKEGKGKESIALSQGRARAFPPDWAPSEELMAWCRKTRPDVQEARLKLELEGFKAHAVANNRQAHDWDHAARGWVLKIRLHSTPEPSPYGKPSRQDDGRPKRHTNAQRGAAFLSRIGEAGDA